MQLLAADYIWNRCSREETVSFHPYVDERSNNLSVEARCKLFRAPDVVPQHHPDVLQRVRLIGGDFLTMQNPGVRGGISFAMLDTLPQYGKFEEHANRTP
eukprot:4206444-Pyramimonas_sp.AAC.1